MTSRIVKVWRAVKRNILFRMAKQSRRRHTNQTFIGITGSCAKTTTKTLLSVVLKGRYCVTHNPGSENRLGTTAKTILRTRGSRAVCIQEFGASGAGSLDEMVALFQPTVAVITNVLRDHYTAFRSTQAIAAEKSKLVKALPDSGVAVLNADDPLVLAMSAQTKGRVITYGFSQQADLRAKLFSSIWPDYLTGNLIWQHKSYQVRTKLLGTHWTPAILAAIATALALKVDMMNIIHNLSTANPPEGRFSTVLIPGGPVFICDDFKAPMHSVAPALAFLSDARALRKVVVIGSISDFPGSSSRKYKRVTDDAVAVADLVLLVNPFASPKLTEASEHHRRKVLCFKDLKSADQFLSAHLKPGDLVLLKGSRKADHFERLVMRYDHKITCWQSSCANPFHCRQCPLLRKRARSLEAFSRSRQT
jgi:UDP-N-acetylmuramoyl-tripeptide--D-alanyl-D-alanine ligase